jgi:prophage tail gpP-like protein
MNHEVRLTLADGTPLVGWPEVDVTIDMLSPGSPWTLTLHYSDDVSTGLWSLVQRRCLLEESVVLWIDGACQLRGRIEQRRDHISRAGASVTISGRDIAARAMDWDADPTIQLRGLSLQDALTRLFQDVGLTPEILSGAGALEIQSTPRRTRSSSRRRAERATPTNLKVQPGERIWQVCEKLCRRQGYLLWCAPSFRDRDANHDAVGPVVDVPNETIPQNPTLVFARLENGDGTWRGNILESDYDLSSMNVPTLVTGFAHTRLNSDGDTSDRRAVVNQFLRDHPMVRPTRPLGLLPKPRYIQGERARGGDEVEKECQKVISEANANLEVYECTVQGFGQAGKLYAVNAIALVRDEARIPSLSQNMLITRVHFHQSRQRGQVSKVRMVPVGAIKVYPDA